MAISDDLKLAVKNILIQFAPTGSRKAYKRTISKTGGDQLLDIGVTVTNTDTLLSPQPAFRRLGQNMATIAGTSKTVIADYVFVFSVEAISRTELLGSTSTIVLKDSSGNEEILYLVDYTDPAVSEVDVAYIGFYRSSDR